MIEKVLNISGKEVKFKSTAATLRHYRNNFGRDMLKDVIHLQKRLNKVNNSEEQFEVVDLEMFENLAWSMAKTADDSIGTIDNWLNDFETFAITKVLPEIMTLLVNNMKTETEEKN